MHTELAVSLSQLAHTACEVVAQSYKAVTQNEFLQRLGIEARLHQLLANAKDGTKEENIVVYVIVKQSVLTCPPLCPTTTEETQERLVEDVTRLLHPDQMGTMYASRDPASQVKLPHSTSHPHCPQLQVYGHRSG